MSNQPYNRNRNRRTLRRTLLFTTLAAGLYSAGALHAETGGLERGSDTDTQQTTAQEDTPASRNQDVVDIDRVAVTASAASRINRPGFDAPTPTISISAEELQVGGRSNIAAVLGELPQFKLGTSPRTAGTVQSASRAPANLRGLGVNRTLVLLDGRRFKGDDDLNTIPSILVGGADIVTGGASAAWGSGAVAGVVNVAIDETLVGAKLDLRTGISDYNDGEEQAFGIAAGNSFAGGRGHVVFGAEYYNNEGITPRSRRENTGYWSSLSNGDGTYTITPDVTSSVAVAGGLIRTGVLAGNVFNPDGSLRAHDFGRVVGTSSVGGDGGGSNVDHAALSVPDRNYRLLGRATYDITDSVTLTAQLRHARSYGDFRRWLDNDATTANYQTIHIDNAFLPEAVRSALEAAGETSFSLGRWNSDYGWPDSKFDRKISEFTVALDGRINESWSWDAYYSHGEYQGLWSTPGWLLRDNYAWAVDSVVDPNTGNPICRIALSNPLTDCVPLNVFGHGNGSDAAIAYIQGQGWREERERLDAAGLSVQGDVLQLPAGPLSVSYGFEARREKTVNWVDEDSRQNNFRTVNYAPIEGDFLVREVFGEALIPVVDDVGILNDLELNLAARYSDYSTSGGVWQWKLGATNEFFPGFKGRVSYSRDVRAPSISDLYATGGVSYSSVADPFTNTTVSTTSYSGGNPDLTPEESDTFTIGFSYSPPAIPGLSVSLDYYSIDIDEVIATVGVGEIVRRCYEGNQSLCDRFVRNPDNSLIIQAVPVNLSNYKTDGIDFDVAYATPASRFISALDGGLSFRLIGTWVNSLTTDDGVSSIEYVNNLNSSGFGVPDLQVSGLASYQGPRFGGNLRIRHIASGLHTTTVDTTNNDIGSYTYFDLGLNATLYRGQSSQVQLYANVNNLFDKTPPINSQFAVYHDVIGRYYSAGLRLNF